MSGWKIVVIILLSIVASACQNPQPVSSNPRADEICARPVKTDSGLVEGLAETGTATCAWRGIPYAAPPVRDLRWKAPQPVKPWDGIRNGSLWGNRCMQMDNFMMNFFNSDPSGGMSEDCLYLNIWRPKKQGKFPVMFFLHGGGLGLGTGNTPTYWGDRLAETGDVMVVTINYRLSLLGFLTLPALQAEDPNQSSGNYGILDQIAALKWVKKNIENFGADPNNITIFGESGGGWSVCTLAATPLANGLFQRAIMESGGCNRAETMEQGYKQGKELAEKIGCQPHDLDCLRKVPGEKIRDASPVPTFTRFTAGPHIDGYLLNATPLEMIRAGNFNPAAWIVGNNRDELSMNLWSLRKDLRKIPPEKYQAALVGFLSISETAAGELARLYPLSEFANTPMKAYQRMASDFSLICPSYDGIAAASAQGAQTYLYRFDYADFRTANNAGAMHAIELPFVFNSFDRRMFNIFFSGKMREKAKPLSKIIQAFWINFAKTGNPNGPVLPEWPGFDPGKPQMQILDAKVRNETAKLSDRCRFWEEHKIALDW